MWKERDQFLNLSILDPSDPGCLSRTTQQNVFNLMGAIYSAVLFLGTSNATSVQPVFAGERAVSYRERGAGMYSPTAWVLAMCAIEIPYVLVQTVVYSCITYSMIHFEWTAGKSNTFLFSRVSRTSTTLRYIFCGLQLSTNQACSSNRLA